VSLEESWQTTHSTSNFAGRIEVGVSSWRVNDLQSPRS